MNNPKIQWSGIDTLKVGVGIHWDPITRQYQMALLDTLQTQAREGREPTLETLQYRWAVTPYGRKKYRWGITTGYISFFFSDEDQPSGDNTPNCWVEMGPLWTCRHDLYATKTFIDITLNNFGTHATWIKPSELHLTTDISTDEPMKYEDFYAEHHAKKWTTRARLSRLIETPDETPKDPQEAIFRNGSLEYFRVGAGHLLMRIYNKTKELKVHTDKLWEKTLWNTPTAENVTRIEFQIRREKLYQFGMNSIDDLKDAPGIWAYLTNMWFYMHDKPTQSRHPEPPNEFWQTAQCAQPTTDERTPVQIWKPNAIARINSGIGNLLSASAQFHPENPDRSEAKELVEMLKIWKETSQQAKPNYWDAVAERRDRLKRRGREHIIAPHPQNANRRGDVISHPPTADAPRPPDTTEHTETK